MKLSSNLRESVWFVDWPVGWLASRLLGRLAGWLFFYYLVD